MQHTSDILVEKALATVLISIVFFTCSVEEIYDFALKTKVMSILAEVVWRPAP